MRPSGTEQQHVVSWGQLWVRSHCTGRGGGAGGRGGLGGGLGPRLIGYDACTGNPSHHSFSFTVLALSADTTDRPPQESTRYY